MNVTNDDVPEVEMTGKKAAIFPLLAHDTIPHIHHLTRTTMLQGILLWDEFLFAFVLFIFISVVWLYSDECVHPPSCLVPSNLINLDH